MSYNLFKPGTVVSETFARHTVPKPASGSIGLGFCPDRRPGGNNRSSPRPGPTDQLRGPETLVLYRKRTGATASVSLDLRSSLSIQPFEGGRFVRGGRYGISIDFGSEVIEKKSICGASFKSKFIDLTMKPRLMIASS